MAAINLTTLRYREPGPTGAFTELPLPYAASDSTTIPLTTTLKFRSPLNGLTPDVPIRMLTHAAGAGGATMFTGAHLGVWNKGPW